MSDCHETLGGETPASQWSQIFGTKLTGGDGWIYFISTPYSGAVKIGWTENPPKRLSVYAAHNAAPVGVLLLFRGSRDDERALHRRFSEYRYRAEWFRLDGELLEACCSAVNAMSIFERYHCQDVEDEINEEVAA